MNLGHEPTEQEVVHQERAKLHGHEDACLSGDAASLGAKREAAIAEELNGGARTQRRQARGSRRHSDQTNASREQRKVDDRGAAAHDQCSPEAQRAIGQTLALGHSVRDCHTERTFETRT